MNHGTRGLVSSAGTWPGHSWLARRWRRARVQLKRALRGHGPSSNLRAQYGMRLLVSCAAAAGIPGMPDAGGSQQEPDPADTGPGANGDKKRERWTPKSGTDLGHPKRRVTDIFLALNTFLFVLNWLLKDSINLWGVKCSPLINQGELHRLLTPMFLHLNPFHLAVNLQALNEVGPYVELTSGHARTAVIYLASGLAATLASHLLNPAATSLGASGAVYGLGAALALFFMRHRQTFGERACDSGLRSLGLAAAVNAVYAAANKRLDNWGHLGGFLAGGVLAACLGPRYTTFRSEEEGGVMGLQDQPPLPWLARREPIVPAPAAAAVLPAARRRMRQSPGRKEAPGEGSREDVGSGRRGGSGGGGVGPAGGSGGT
ncbi:hypothetical protein Agub_g7820 [Astrephomene gubernaculifera]|uniref:Peptidase S54 rhomboid domain-containing protein n=1 Tax=Astrephomene gubernaculifera TaxID=47775 RepID=A0AAD3HMQ0_9CHLO|nr:hypothetical protein Agub_g7820 [Astrephomene gubernaculifera]